MKSIFKILVLAVVPMLVATTVVDRGLAANAGSQLIFQSKMDPAHQDFISVANTNNKLAVTVLVQYYNDEMKRVLWYLRVIPGGGNFMVDPFDHMIPGQDTNVKDELGNLPDMTQTEGKKLPGINSGRFVIAVTAVGANVKAIFDRDADGDLTDAEDASPAVANAIATVNVLFPSFLAADLHGTDNIDNCGKLQSNIAADSDAATQTALRMRNNNLALTKAADADDNCDADDDHTSKNVGGLTVDNAEPIAFNYLSGHFTVALVGTSAGGSDQTASWGGVPVIRPAVNALPVAAIAAADADDTDTTHIEETVAVTAAPSMTIDTAYTTLNGMDMDATTGGGRLADKMAGGMSGRTYNFVAGYTSEGGNKIANRAATAPEGGARFFGCGREESGQWRKFVPAGSVLR